MRPHPQYADDLGLLIDLIDQAMLNVYPARKNSLQIADEFFIRRRILEWIFTQEVKGFFGIFPQTGSLQFFASFKDSFENKDSFEKISFQLNYFLPYFY